MKYFGTSSSGKLLERSDQSLLEELVLALRNAAIFKLSDFGISSIQVVQRIHCELSRRQVSMDETLWNLTASTSWLMESFLSECLQYPLVSPAVRILSGARRDFLCQVCKEREWKDENDSSICSACVDVALSALRNRKDTFGFVIFTSYSPSRRCRHADDHTLMIMADPQDSWERPFCEECLIAEQERRSLKTNWLYQYQRDIA
jgi:hypothetical protein